MNTTQYALSGAIPPTAEPGALATVARQTLADSTRELFELLWRQSGLDEIVAALPACLARLFDAEDCGLVPREAIAAQARRARSGEAADRAEGRVYFLPAARRAVESGMAVLLEGDRVHAASVPRGWLFRKSVICAPILVDARVLGVIWVGGPNARSCFDHRDIGLLEVIALFVARSMRHAGSRDAAGSACIDWLRAPRPRNADVRIPASVPQMDRMARIVARSFYREMAKAGFGCAQIVNVASEIIAELTRRVGARD